MPRNQAVFPIKNLETTKRQLLAWADSFSVAVYLDSNEYPRQRYHSWECLVAAGTANQLQASAGQAFAGLRDFFEEKQDWLFGYFSYDLKNEVEKLHSANPSGIGLPDLFFFQPEIVVGIRIADYGLRITDYSEPLGQIVPSSPDGSNRGPGTDSPGIKEEGHPIYILEIFSLTAIPEEIYKTIMNPNPSQESGSIRNPQSVIRNPLAPRMPKPEYLATVESIRRHIIEGDVYELNLCQEFFAEKAEIDPKSTFERLNALTRAPFAAYFRHYDRYLLCASPERFLRKEDSVLISQPIKGTRRRHADPAEDARIRDQLRASEKDRAENVMIVDLVRNDLARNCLPGTVRVEELFGIYAFQTVHQMISTVTGTLRRGVHPIDALRDAFPMGSMTGAPKVMAMELIEQYERTRRGLFSGALGYFAPGGDFDFNVVIRSILYNAGTGYLSCQVGGAIVYDSEPEQEYEECMVKAGALMQALEGDRRLP